MTGAIFPEGFQWGVATAAYQIEGAVAEDGRGASIWDTFSHTPGAVLRGDTGDIACDHYHRWESDLDLLADLGVTSYRFSVAWPRVQPRGSGTANPAGLRFYDRLVDGLLERGITPMVTLYHWDLPQALQDTGGWANRDTAARFAEYATLVYKALGDRVPQWLTLNEPYCTAFVGHLEGRHAPGVKDEAIAVRTVHHLLLAHGFAIQALRAEGATTGLGITCNLTSVHPASDSVDDVAACKRLDLFENRLFLDPLFRAEYPADAEEYYRGITDFSFVADGDMKIISEPIDHFGVNYYERHLVRADPADPVRGWQRVPALQPTISNIGVHPEGLREILNRLNDDYTQIPLYVTETGIALHDYVDPNGHINDHERIAFYESHICAVHDAIADGVDVRGIAPWSFMDNYEWAWGYAYRFGMYYVDYRTQERIPKASLHWYRDVIRRHGLA
jgi:beta-glucosidase